MLFIQHVGINHNRSISTSLFPFRSVLSHSITRFFPLFPEIVYIFVYIYRFASESNGLYLSWKWIWNVYLLPHIATPSRFAHDMHIEHACIRAHINTECKCKHGKRRLSNKFKFPSTPPFYITSKRILLPRFLFCRCTVCVLFGTARESRKKEKIWKECEKIRKNQLRTLLQRMLDGFLWWIIWNRLRPYPRCKEKN